MLHTCCLSNLLLKLISLSTSLIILTSCLLALVSVLNILLLIIGKVILHHRHKILHRNAETGKLDISVAFFHPYCNAGGGGERVLWCAIKAINVKYPHVRCIVYTGDVESTPEQIITKAENTFNLNLSSSSIEFVYLNQRKLVEARLYPFFTLLGQSIGSIFLGLEAAIKFVPTVYIDSMGYAFTIPIFKYLAGCRVGCYVHYPTISTDMLSVVANQNAALNNARFISNSPLLTACKLFYYHLFAFLYGMVGRVSEVTMVNSSWTKSHVYKIWNCPDRIYLVYPPCDVSAFEDIPITDSDDKKYQSLVSVSQFRPEKDHRLQINAFHLFLESVDQIERDKYRLVLIGGCRNEGDEKRVEELKKLAEELGVADFVQFKLNISFDEMKEELSKATIGLHTMWNEHFGIGVVECMAAGLVMLAHDSGGPKMDIVTDYEGKRTGFLASDKHKFAENIRLIFNMTPQERISIRINARKSVVRFSTENFDNNFLEAVKLLLL